MNLLKLLLRRSARPPQPRPLRQAEEAGLQPIDERKRLHLMALLMRMP